MNDTLEANIQANPIILGVAIRVVAAERQLCHHELAWHILLRLSTRLSPDRISTDDIDDAAFQLSADGCVGEPFVLSQYTG